MWPVRRYSVHNANEGFDRPRGARYVTSRLGALLHELRDAAGLTQEELAERSGVGVRTIRRLETGKHGDARTATLRLLADPLAATCGRSGEDLLRRLQDALLGVAPPPAGSPDDSAGSEPVSLPPRRTPERWIPLADTIDSLAAEVRAAWQREEERRRVNDPFALPVRWHAAGHLADHWENVLAAPAGATVDAPALDGDLREIARLYRSIPSRRLVVLGRAGSGKTILTLRFVLDLLESRAADEPVPVIFSLGSWDPTKTELDEWLVDQLLRDHPGLTASTAGGTTLAAALVEAECVLPVLDGFDELARGLHTPALKALRASPRRPLLLTSRTEQYAEVTRAEILNGAAVIELDDLSHGDLVDYLPRTARPGEHGADGRAVTAWDPVLARMGDERPDPATADLAAVLSTPLMVTLARTQYSDAPDGSDPADLLDNTRFPNRDKLEDHLLSGYVTTVYGRRSPRPPASAVSVQTRNWEPQHAERYLGHLARYLNKDAEHERRDLAWWQLSSAVRPATRILAVVIACALCTDLAVWLVTVPVALSAGISAGDTAHIILLQGVLFGPAISLGLGLVYGLRTTFLEPDPEPSRMQFRWPRGIGRSSAARVRRSLIFFVGGWVGGFAIGVGYGAAMAILARAMGMQAPRDLQALSPTLSHMPVFGLIFGTSVAVVFGLVTLFEAPVDLGSAATPKSLLAANRTTVLRQLLLFGPLLTLGFTISGRLWVDALQGLLGPTSWGWTAGLVIGIAVGISGSISFILAFTAWGQWLLLGRIVLPLIGWLPWAPVAFLEDAYRRGVLRQSGAVYQFRHARLQERLGRATREDLADRQPHL